VQNDLFRYLPRIWRKEIFHKNRARTKYENHRFSLKISASLLVYSSICTWNICCKSFLYYCIGTLKENITFLLWYFAFYLSELLLYDTLHCCMIVLVLGLITIDIDNGYSWNCLTRDIIVPLIDELWTNLYPLIVQNNGGGLGWA
jgi:hypothetical protein